MMLSVGKGKVTLHEKLLAFYEAYKAHAAAIYRFHNCAYKADQMKVVNAKQAVLDSLAGEIEGLLPRTGKG